MKSSVKSRSGHRAVATSASFVPGRVRFESTQESAGTRSIFSPWANLAIIISTFVAWMSRERLRKVITPPNWRAGPGSEYASIAAMSIRGCIALPMGQLTGVDARDAVAAFLSALEKAELTHASFWPSSLGPASDFLMLATRTSDEPRGSC